MRFDQILTSYMLQCTHTPDISLHPGFRFLIIKENNLLNDGIISLKIRDDDFKKKMTIYCDVDIL